MMPRHTRVYDDDGRFRRVGILYARYGRDFVVLVAVALAAWSVIRTSSTIHALKDEAAERRNDQCLIFEREEADDISALDRTYRYLAALSSKQLAEPLNQAVLAQLPTTIRAAQTPDAPEYCNAPGVGLPEPSSPPLPKRPRNLGAR